MPSGENSGEGSVWSSWINKPGDVKNDGTQVTVKLVGGSGGFCAGKSACVKPLDSKASNAATDGPRQR
ncbi:hypothetical protein P691DRAFT_766316 [Macrolepiota fuliginosa MF-IS2]|uniref:Uncharacterized protein n=1 Tax=Macrolepiota fuliginosa MF-IS2 TaxID=1400762 RepID=A0A9P6BW25_9AGAR|nr:hypothetical protein P691DRAFT_766316 [Macrolepiota fuliginosa MF-IS2]